MILGMLVCAFLAGARRLLLIMVCYLKNPKEGQKIGRVRTLTL